MSNIQLFQGNCLKLMENIPDKSVDMILCDLPYGTTQCKWDIVIPLNDYVKLGKKILYEKDVIFACVQNRKSLDEGKEWFHRNKERGLWTHYGRIIKDNGAIVLFGIEPFSTNLRISNLNQYRHEWYWNKINGGNFVQSKNHPLKIIENIIVFSKQKVNYYPQLIKNSKEYAEILKAKNRNKKESSFTQTVPDKYFKMASGKFQSQTDEEYSFPKNLIEISKFTSECNSRNRVHPTQKPVVLLEYLIKTYTNDDETVLDNCMGSGSTGVACVNTGRNFIGMELDEKYFNIAKERIEKAGVE